MYKLSIVIPTYNRPKQLAETVKILLEQVLCHANVEFIILDNCSKIRASDILGEVVAGRDLPPRIRVIRHPANIGGVYNILRSFEVANGEWLWCASDDDTPASDAVETILSDCEKGTHCYAYYGLKSGVPDVSDCVDGRFVSNSISEWVKRIPSYGARLFISESVFRISDMRPYMSLAYLVASSGAPHLTLAYCAVSNGGRYLLSRKQIAAYKPPENGFGYNFARLAYGSTLLGMVHSRGTAKDFKRFFVDSYQNWISPSMFLRHLLIMHGTMSAIEKHKRFSMISKVMKPFLFGNPLQWCKWTICEILSCVPSLASKILKMK